MIDGGPSRTSRAADLQSARRVEPVRQDPQSVAQPVPAQGAAGTTRAPLPRRTKRSILPIIAAIVATLALVAGGLWLLSSRTPSLAGIDSDKYQAVFLSSGQVYFGKLEPRSPEYLALTGVFYIQTQPEAAEGSESATLKNDANMQLIKLGDEVHGPEDAMMINRDQVLFIENLKPSGKVAGLIDQYKQGKQ